VPDLFITNFNRNFTGVSATAANVLRQQLASHDLRLIGHPLPGAPAPITRRAANALSRTPPPGKPFAIWHVRRDPEMIAALWARDVLRLPIRIVFTSAAQRYHGAFPRWLISRMDAVIATTDRAAEFVNSTATVPHGVDTERFFPSKDRTADWAALGLGGSIGIATLGRIRPEKGSDLFVDAMLRLLPNHPGLTALLVGKVAPEHADFAASLKAKITAAGLSDRILFTGEIAPDHTPALMRSLSLVMQLPRYEGYGMVPLEGMASGTPFVASEAGYYRAFSDNGTTGQIVAQDATLAADAATALLNDPARLQGMAQNARQTAQSRFSAATEAASIEAVYQSLWSCAKGA
jgi:mannosyltransferase